MSYSDHHHPSQEEPTPTGSSKPKKDNSNKTTYSLSKSFPILPTISTISFSLNPPAPLSYSVKSLIVAPARAKPPG